MIAGPRLRGGAEKKEGNERGCHKREASPELEPAGRSSFHSSGSTIRGSKGF